MTSSRRFATPLLAAWVLGCGAPHGTMQVLSPGSMELASAPVGSVTVALAPTLPESRRTAFVEHEDEAVVRQAIVDAFTKRSHWDPFKASGAEEGLFTYSSSARFRSLAGVLAAELANYIAPAGRSAAAGNVDPSAGGMQRMATGY